MLFPPRIDGRGLPGDEADAALKLDDQLGDLAMYADRFKQTLALFDHCGQLHAAAIMAKRAAKAANQNSRPHLEQQLMFGAWQAIAARDAVSTIYHFFKTLAFITANKNRCSSLRDGIDNSEFKLVDKWVASKFPDWNDIRNLVEHEAENWNDDDERKKMFLSEKHPGVIGIAAPGRAAGFAFSGALMGRNYTFTFEDRFVALPISNDTLAVLENTSRIVFTCFAGAQKATLNTTYRELPLRVQDLQKPPR
jgi:hypothetical protein